MSREELAWAAGFFDGEGHTGINLTSRKRYPTGWPVFRIDIAQKDRRALDRFVRAVGLGGKVHLVRENTPGKNPYFRYYLTRFELAQQAIINLWAWLSPVKREQAKQALSNFHTNRRLALENRASV